MPDSQGRLSDHERGTLTLAIVDSWFQFWLQTLSEAETVQFMEYLRLSREAGAALPDTMHGKWANREATEWMLFRMQHILSQRSPKTRSDTAARKIGVPHA